MLPSAWSRFRCRVLGLRGRQQLRWRHGTATTSIDADETRDEGAGELRNRGCIIARMRHAAVACWSVRDGAGERDWVRAHAALTRLARERAAADAEEGRWLLVAWRSGAHVHLGFGSFSEYVERLLGYSPRTTRE